MKAAFNIALTLLFCGSVFAESIQQSFFLRAGEHGLFEVQHTDKSFELVIDSAHYEFKQHFDFALQYIYVPATSNSTQQVKISVSVESLKQSKTKIKITRVTPNEIGIQSYVDTLKTFQNLPQSSNISTELPSVLQKLSIFYRDNDFQESVRHQLLYSLVSRSMWPEAYQVMNSLASNSGRSVISQCHLINKYIQKNESSTEPLLLGMLSKLAGTLSVYFRNNGNLKNHSESQLTSIAYEQFCGPLFTNDRFHFDLENGYTRNDKWQLSKDANLLFAYLLTQSSNKETLETADIKSNLWFYYNFNGLHKNALMAAKNALKIFEALSPNNIDGIAKQLNSIFISSLRLGQYAEARVAVNRALKISENAHVSHYEQMLFNSGYLYNTLGEFEISSRYFTNLIQSYESEMTPLIWKQKTCGYSGMLKTLIARSAVMNASSLRQNDQLEEAKTWLKCAESLLINSNDYYELVVQIELAKVALYNKKYDNAEQAILKVLRDPRILNNTRIDALLIYTKILQHKNRVDELQQQLKKLAKLFNYQSFYDLTLTPSDIYPVKQVEVLTFLISLHQNDKHNKWLTLFTNTAIQLVEKHSSAATNLQAWKAARFKFVQIYVASLLNSEKGPTKLEFDQLFKVLERYYSIDPIGEQNVFALSQSTIEDEKRTELLFKKWINLESNLLHHGSISLLNALDRARDDYIAIIKRIQKKPRELRFNRIKDIQSKIPPNHIIIRYVLSEESSFALIITATETFLKPIKKLGKLNQLIEDTLTNTHSSQRFAQNTFPLAQQLLPIDIINSGQYTKLVIIPDGQLHKLPFSSLHIGDQDSQYSPLITKMETVLTYSMNTYYSDQAINKRTSNTFRVSLFAGPNLSLRNEKTLNYDMKKYQNRSFSSYADLPGTIEEANTIMRLFKHTDVQVGLKRNATSKFLMSEQTRNAPLLHIATHGYYNPKTPELVGLITSPDNDSQSLQSSFLSMSELLSKPVNSDLVVISGCETMLGKDYKGSGMRSISRGFLSQGAGAVLGTLWPIQDRATSEFMKQFYTSLIEKNGNSSAALRETKIRFAMSGRYRNPTFWAGFILMSSSKHREILALNH